MILGFKEHFDKQKTKPTYFREKILAGVGYIPSDVGKMPKNGQGVLHLIEHPKIHTIRAGHRWKEGDLMHMAYGVRTKNYCQFNKGIPELERVKSVQDIRIDHYPLSNYIKVTIDGKSYRVFEHEKIHADHDVIRQLAINDGFESIDHFFSWFSEDFSGQIIHFSSFRYE